MIWSNIKLKIKSYHLDKALWHENYPELHTSLIINVIKKKGRKSTMNEDTISAENDTGLNRYGLYGIIISLLYIVLQAVIFFVSAGQIVLPRAWIYFIAAFAFKLITILIIGIVNPDFLNQRAKSIGKHDAKLWDRILTIMLGIISAGLIFVIMGLDVGRFQWLSLNIYFSVFIQFFILGFVLFIVSTIFGGWAVLENSHFEVFVRIQKDREHHVISTGPYKYIRHPGYASMILANIAAPFILGSILGFIPAGIVFVILIIRTSREDKTLNKELDGYSEYTKKVKYRLFPGLW